MRTFIAIGKKQGLRIVFKYGLNGVLNSVEYDGNWTDDLINRAKSAAPENVQLAISYTHNDNPKNPFLFKEQTDLSFETFYKKYPNKLGKKIAATQIWNKMSDAKRLDALLYLEIFIPQINKQGTTFPYATSYLNGKYWE